MHEGGYGVRRTDDGLFVFTKPDGTRVPENGKNCFRGNNWTPLRSYFKTHDPNLSITPETSRCQWRGESPDYSQAIEAMQFLEQKAAEPSPPP